MRATNRQVGSFSWGWLARETKPQVMQGSPEHPATAVSAGGSWHFSSLCLPQLTEEGDLEPVILEGAASPCRERGGLIRAKAGLRVLEVTRAGSPQERGQAAGDPGAG